MLKDGVLEKAVSSKSEAPDPLHALPLDLQISCVASHIAQTLTSKTESLGMFESSILSKL